VKLDQGLIVFGHLLRNKSVTGGVDGEREQLSMQRRRNPVSMSKNPLGQRSWLVWNFCTSLFVSSPELLFTSPGAGNLAEGSTKNEREWPLRRTFSPKFFGAKVRHDLQMPSSFGTTDHFSMEKALYGFPFIL
jgi:hypothetical protein